MAEISTICQSFMVGTSKKRNEKLPYGFVDGGTWLLGCSGLIGDDLTKTRRGGRGRGGGGNGGGDGGGGGNGGGDGGGGGGCRIRPSKRGISSAHSVRSRLDGRGQSLCGIPYAGM